MRKILVFGLGSSGTRFIRLLQAEQCQVTVFAHRPDVVIPAGCHGIDSLTDLSAFDAAVIASPSATHGQYLRACLEQRLPTLVDKPVVDEVAVAKELLAMAKQQKILVKVGFNLRFLPIVQTIRTFLAEGKLGRLLYAHLHVGQYLPDWRPQQDYTQGYSSSHHRGGGAALDLIHELDLACGWFPGVKLSTTFSDKLSSLAVDTEDYVEVASQAAPRIQVTLDYLSHLQTRRYMLVGEQGTVVCDVYQPSFRFKAVSGESQQLTDPNLFDVKQTYEFEVKDFLAAVDRQEFSTPTVREWGIDALQVALKARRHVPR